MGVAGNVGAMPIHALAGDLDAAFRRGDRAAAQAALVPLGARLPAMIAALQAALAQGEVATGNEVINKPVDAGLLARLATVLASDDRAAIDLLAANEPSLRQALAQDFDLIRRRIEAFDFPEALKRVRAVLAGVADRQG